jgi:heme/copper-type cytochrome/quinol oxidase subunit 3
MADAVYEPRSLPVGSREYNATGWLGALCLIATEGSLFAYLLFSYAYFAVQHGKAWLPDAHPSLRYSLPGTIILVTSSATAWWSERSLKRGDRAQHLAALTGTIVLGLVFLILQLFEWKSKHFTLSSSAYGSLFFTITGFHMLHVIVGVISLSTVLGWSLAGYFSPRRHLHLTISSAYWHFVDVVWLAVFFTFYITPYVW